MKIFLTILAFAAMALFLITAKRVKDDQMPAEISMAIPPEPPKSQTVLLGGQWGGVYRTLDLETGIVCYYPTGSGAGISCFQFEEGPTETPTANQLARM